MEISMGLSKRIYCIRRTPKTFLGQLGVAFALLSSVGCVVHAGPMLGGASSIEVNPNWTADERRDILDKRTLEPSVIVKRRVVRRGNRSHVRREYDHTALKQGGGFDYTLADYLPVLQAEGIATDIENPRPYQVAAVEERWKWGLGSSLLGLGFATGAHLMDLEEETLVMTDAAAVVVILVGQLIGWSEAMAVSLPAREAARKAAAKRSSWAHQFNSKIADKLQLTEPIKDEIKQSGVIYVPARN
jgi:hypothetical protein